MHRSNLSEYFHMLLGIFAKSKAEAEARSKGIGGGIRRSMSIPVVRSQSLCLLESIAQLGSGAKSAVHSYCNITLNSYIAITVHMISILC